MILLVIYACSCVIDNQRSEEEFLLRGSVSQGDTTYLGPFPDTVMPSGIFFGYVKYDSIIRVELRHKGNILTIPVEYEEKRTYNIPGCSFYKLHWFNDSIVVLSRGCGMPPNVDSKVISYRKDSFNMFSTARVLSVEENYGNILVFDEKNQNPIYVLSLKNGQIVDELPLEPMIQKSSMTKAYFLDNFEPLKGRNSHELFVMNRDTVFFNVNGAEQFLTYKLE